MKTVEATLRDQMLATKLHWDGSKTVTTFANVAADPRPILGLRPYRHRGR
jgi:hypothetical protein